MTPWWAPARALRLGPCRLEAVAGYLSWEHVKTTLVWLWLQRACRAAARLAQAPHGDLALLVLVLAKRKAAHFYRHGNDGRNNFMTSQTYFSWVRSG